jgi:outer membrane protein W
VFRAPCFVLRAPVYRRSRYDFHAGAGASRLTFERLANTPELTLLGIESIRFHNKIVPVLDAGASFRLGPRWAITLDAKWFDIRTMTTATYPGGTREGANLNLKQITAGVGLSFRY